MPLPVRSSLSSASDGSLVAGTRAGQAAPWAELYRRYAADVLAVGHRLTASSHHAEDVLHDVFLGLPEALRHYEERGSFATWLRRVAAFAAVSRLRAVARRREVDFAPELGSHPDAGADGAAATRMVTDGWRGDPPLRAALEHAIAALPSALRAVYVLRAVEDYTHAEIAERLGIRVGASEVRIHRAVRALRTSLVHLL